MKPGKHRGRKLKLDATRFELAVVPGASGSTAWAIVPGASGSTGPNRSDEILNLRTVLDSKF